MARTKEKWNEFGEKNKKNKKKDFGFIIKLIIEAQIPFYNLVATWNDHLYIVAKPN